MSEIQQSAAILAAFVGEWAETNTEEAKGALAASLRKALAIAPHAYHSGSRWIDYGVISAICRELEGPLAPDVID